MRFKELFDSKPSNKLVIKVECLLGKKNEESTDCTERLFDLLLYIVHCLARTTAFIKAIDMRNLFLLHFKATLKFRK